VSGGLGLAADSQAYDTSRPTAQRETVPRGTQRPRPALSWRLWGGAPKPSQQVRTHSPSANTLSGGIGYLVSLYTQVSYPIVPKHLRATKAGCNSRK
jgi:hypothetical protein